MNIKNRVLRGTGAIVGTAVVATVALSVPAAPSAPADGQTTLASCVGAKPPPSPDPSDPYWTLMCTIMGWVWRKNI